MASSSPHPVHIQQAKETVAVGTQLFELRRCIDT
jgi:hypothetical protein